MSNGKNNKEQDQLIELTPTQQNPGAAKASDFIIENRDGGQRLFKHSSVTSLPTP